jgi:hypothetical protein
MARKCALSVTPYVAVDYLAIGEKISTAVRTRMKTLANAR